MDILDKQDYQKLLEFSKGLNPMDINFQEKTIQLMLQYFDFSGAAFPLIDGNGYYHRLAYANFNHLSMVIYNNYCYEQDFFAPANYNKNLEKTVLMVDDFMTFDEYETSALYNDVLSRNNFYYEALVLLRGEHKEYIGAVAVYHKKNSSGFTEREGLILKEIGNIIEKQFQLYLHLYEKNQYVTNYAIFFQYISEKKDAKWRSLMESKGITKRECQIANFLRIGYNNAKIAENLGISENTVKRHKEKIYKKLEINRVNQINLLYEKI